MQTNVLNSLLGSNTERFMQIIVEKAPIGIYTINKEGIIDFVNRKFLQISGDSEQELLGLNSFTLPSYQQFGLVQYFYEGLQGKAFEIETRYISYISKKESYRHYIGEPMRSETGEGDHLLLLVEDITEKKRLELEKDEFFSIASHELRTPLTAIMGYTSMMQAYKNQLPKEEIEKMIDDIQQISKRLLNIVNDFLDMSRLETGKIKFTLTTVDLSKLITSVVNEYKISSTNKNLYVTFAMSGTAIPHIVADSERLKQVLINLIGNALKFTKTGGITISVRNEEKQVKILVHDTGNGITVEDQKELFKKFRQIGSSSNQDAIKSSGLGLYISKMLMHGMRGDLVLEASEPDKGSTFAIVLPKTQVNS
jgi:PAS domain S-box-containing protein